jgi:hypothetical protein
MNNNQNEPDQNNTNSKVKYFLDTRTFNQSSTFLNNQLLDNININTSYTRNKDQTSNILPDSCNKLQSNFDSKYFPSSLLETNVNKSSKNGLQFDYANKINIENEIKIQSAKDCTSTSLNNCRIHDRRRNLDHSDYIRSGSMSNSGFGNLNNLSKIKYGESTRDIQGSIRDSEVDRFHFTYRNYQHEVYGSNPLPGDTRYLNKKF